MNKLIEALSKLLPQEKMDEVKKAVEEIMAEAKAELDKEYNTKLEEAYAQLSEEVKQGEKVAEQGYSEAWGVIQDLRNRLETQRAEFDAALEEGYEEAYQMLVAEKGKADKIEAELYEQYDKKLAEMREYMIDKVDEFLQHKGKEIYEQARRDLTNDPRLVEHKVTLHKVIDTVADYISDEDYAQATNSKLEEAVKAVEELKGQVRILEARNIRVSTENNKLNEHLRQQAELIKEHTTNVVKEEKKVRVEKAENAQGRGKAVVTEAVEVISEKPEATNDSNKSEDQIVENSDQMHSWQVLAGIKKGE
jgi:hypothetical protein